MDLYLHFYTLKTLNRIWISVKISISLYSMHKFVHSFHCTGLSVTRMLTSLEPGTQRKESSLRPGT